MTAVVEIVGVRVAGRFELVDGAWEIDAAPDVMVRLKRIFPRCAATFTGAIRLAATAEVAAELAWVLKRWPMDASDADRARLQAAAAEHERTEAIVYQILAGCSPLEPHPDWVQPTVALRDYQRQARDLVWVNGGTLAVHDLGLGKTLTSLALLENPDARPAVAVTLSGRMPKQWRKQLAKFYPDLKCLELRNGEKQALEVGGQLPDLITMNYHKLSKWQHELKSVARTVIFDEAQELRRKDSDKYTAARVIASNAKYVIGVSGTPIYNYGAEAYYVLDVIKPGALGTEQEFARQWCGAKDLGPKTLLCDPESLQAHLQAQGLMHRCDYEAAGIPKPRCNPIQQFVPSDPEILEQLQGNAAEMARLILDQTTNPKERFQLAGELDWRLRQASGIAKAPFVADFVKLLLDGGREKILLFGWHLDVYKIWAELLAAYRPRFYTGQQTTTAKDRAVDAFLDGDCRLLIMSLRSGAGLDGLQEVCSTAVIGELDWSPGVHTQAIGRVCRPGQPDEVDAFFCVTDAGADPFMIETLDIKALQAHEFLNPDAPIRDFGPLEQQAQRDRIKRLAADFLTRSCREEHTQGGTGYEVSTRSRATHRR
jgi:superfamily II DNA or RNA helicase